MSLIAPIRDPLIYAADGSVLLDLSASSAASPVVVAPAGLTLQPGAAGVSALTLTPQAGQTAPLLEANGKAVVGTDGSMAPPSAPLVLDGTDPEAIQLQVSGAAGQDIAPVIFFAVPGQAIFMVGNDGAVVINGHSDSEAALVLHDALGVNGPLQAFTVGGAHPAFSIGIHGQVTVETNPGSGELPLTINRQGGVGTPFLVVNSVGSVSITRDVNGGDVGLVVTQNANGVGLEIVQNTANFVAILGGPSGQFVFGGDGSLAQSFTAGAVPLALTNNAVGFAVFRVADSGCYVTHANAAPADADLAAGELGVWFDDTNGAAKVHFKGKQADGTVVNAQLAMA